MVVFMMLTDVWKAFVVSLQALDYPDLHVCPVGFWFLYTRDPEVATQMIISYFLPLIVIRYQ